MLESIASELSLKDRFDIPENFCEQFLALLNRGESPYDYERQLLLEHEKRVQAILLGKIIPPYEVEIQPSSSCNLRCEHCFGSKLTFERLPNRIRTKQDIETIAKRIDEFKEEDFKIEIVKFCGTTGEPLMNPLTAYAIKVFRGLGKKIILFTNGLYLDREVDGKPYYEHVLDTDKLIISLDAASEQTFYDLKGSKGFQKIISSINDIISKRNSHPRISIGYVIGDKNYHEIEEIAELMKNLGVEDIRFRVDFTIPGEVRRHSEEIMASLKRVRTSCENGFKAVPIYSEEEIGNDNNAFNSFGRKCFNQHFWACVGPDAELYACGHRTYSEVRSYGNLLEHSFRELWHSQERVRTLETLPDSLCKFCSPSSSRRNTFMTFLSQIRR